MTGQSTGQTAAPTGQRAALAGRLPRRFGSWYVAEHRIRGMRGYLRTIIATGIGNPLVYLFALGVGLASLVDANAGGVGGVSYLTFIAPALLASAAVTVAGEEFTYPMVMGFKWNPIFYAMNAAPISGKQITNGMIIGVAVRMVPTVALYFVVTVAFGASPSAWAAIGIITATLTGLAVGLPIMAYTSTIQQDRGQLALLQRFVILPMFLFSGTFFPLEQLPLYLQPIGWISPLWHGTQLGRVVAYGHQEPLWLTAAHVAYLLALALVGWAITQRIVTARLNK
jgi:lipooligosaccharide transport system permease protein